MTLIKRNVETATFEELMKKIDQSKLFKMNIPYYWEVAKTYPGGSPSIFK